MGSPRLLLALALTAWAAGCTADDESVDTEQDTGLLLVQYFDILAPAASDCTGSGATGRVPADFTPPEGTRWARLEATFASGRVGIDVTNAEGRRIGFGAGPSPVVVVIEDEATIAGAGTVSVTAFACEATPETPVRVFATFRSGPP